jgi:starch synthase
VHVEYLARALDGLVDLEVHPFARYESTVEDPALAAVSVDVAMAAAVDAEVVHSHTWYANLGGHLSALRHGIPHIATVHSLEPLRPWKAEQLGGGYALSSWCERVSLEAADAIIAVSEGMRADVLECYPAIAPERVRVIYNGIDADEYAPVATTGVLERLGVKPPYVLFVGRVTRQKGLPGLLRAARAFDPSIQLVVCAGAPDTPEIAAETAALAKDLERLVWVEAMLPKPEVIELLSHAAVFACPSVYEPLGIVNLEAMACATPVVASAVGGIVEVVVDGETGFLVESGDEASFAARVNELVADPARAQAMGDAGRRRAIERFDWNAIARETVAVYEQVLASPPR